MRDPPRYILQEKDRVEVTRSIVARFNKAGQALLDPTGTTDAAIVGRMGLRLDIKRDLPEAWHQLRQSGSFSLEVQPEMIPYLLRPVFRGVTGVAAFAVTQPGLGTDLLLAPDWMLKKVAASPGPLTVSHMAPRTAELSNPIQLTLPQSARNKVEELVFTLFLDIAEPEP